ncbi:hypothetical protein [Acinetobacter pollinis]|uniref:hypothetical protein n=1 Tax=Acinetobacter pollinis TaxID=2605270 RepID=UPI0018C27211|nr:hypothetical protein [Acinetobacter pollinis]MBF7694264.1 hypothetical protein [Acinetobacter pollinis]MBF7700890.1 hypothetical protein [Acinetobacter pollinis]
MTYLLLALKYWRECFIALLAFLILCLLMILNHKDHSIEKLKQEHISYVQEQKQKYLEAAQQQQIEMNKVSADYEKLKAEQAKKVEYVTRTINKYIDRPVYHNTCIDDDGRVQLNDLIKSSQTTSTDTK